jgi:hypothetical protein
MQGVRGRGHLPAPARKEQLQGVRGGEHLPAPAPEEQMQGVRGRGGQGARFFPIQRRNHYKMRDHIFL